MKRLIVFLLISIVGAQNATSDTPLEETTTTGSVPPEPSCIGECPEVDPQYSIYLPHDDCGKFCQCSFGQAFVISCPDNLHFNAELEVCDWPDEANCVIGNTTTSINENTSEVSSSTEVAIEEESSTEIAIEEESSTEVAIEEESSTEIAIEEESILN